MLRKEEQDLKHQRLEDAKNAAQEVETVAHHSSSELYFCFVYGCGKSYDTEKRLEKHLSIEGVHNTIEEKDSIADVVKRFLRHRA